MLTAHNYKKIDQEKWDADIKECCKTNPPGQTGCTDCCYDDWNDELHKISAQYNTAVEKAQQKQKQFDFTTSRRDRYAAWLTELDKSDLLARDICNQLKMIAVQTDQIWYNTNKAVQAIEILFCMIREIMLASDGLKTICLELDNCISKNTDPLITGGQGILIYYKDYKTKLDATVKARDEILKNIVDAVVIANLIASTISTRDINSTSDPKYVPCNSSATPPCTPLATIVYGFKTIICEWYKYFACDAPPCPPPGSTATQQGTVAKSTTAPATATPVGQDDTCPPKCELTPTFDFPICKNEYRGSVQKWVDADNALLITISTELNDAKIRAQGLQSCITSLTNAIKAVNPADRCKS